MNKFPYSLSFLFLIVGAVACAQEDASNSFSPQFYAFQNGVAFGSFEDEAKTLKQLGYSGISQVKAGGDNLAKRIDAYDRVGLKVLSIYLNVDDKPIDAELVKPFEDRGAMIELTVRKRTPQTVAAVRQTAELAAQMNIRVALYPHHGFAIAKMSQAMDLIREVDHPNLGVMFNLCHFLRSENADDLEAVLQHAGRRLFAVSTAGADVGGREWRDLIKPLDQGNFPQQRLFGALKSLEFTGPVGLQCYGVPGDKRRNLETSIVAWNKLIDVKTED